MPNTSVEKELQARSTTRRYVELDSLRGIAAVLVLFHHIRYALRYSHPMWAAVPFFAGGQSVDLFFVLSGFVISLPYWAGKGSSYPVYAVRRIVRIYFPFAVAAALSIAGAWIFVPHAKTISPWFGFTWHQRPTWALIGDQYLMSPYPTFNTAFWSLRFEMQMSFLMPAIVWLLRKGNAVGLTIISLLLAYTRPQVLTSWDTFHFIGWSIEVASLFVLGALLAKYHQVLIAALIRARNGRWAILAVSLFLFLDYPTWLSTGHLASVLERRNDLLSGLGAAGIILCTLSMPEMSRLLRHRIPEYLGEISYSLYLVHSLILFASFDLLYRRLPNVLIALLIVCLATVAAHVFYVCVERPCIELAKAIKVSGQTSTLRVDRRTI